MTDTLVVLVTTGSEEEAEIIARTLVEERRAACVNIINPVRSIYRWQGKLQNGREWLLIIKTHASCFTALEKRVHELHSYKVPEVIALPLATGSNTYLDWIRNEVTK
ncbi:MAG: divalent-cation tolerance protein CutA [Candidatus Binatia bacterium]